MRAKGSADDQSALVVFADAHGRGPRLRLEIHPTAATGTDLSDLGARPVISFHRSADSHVRGFQPGCVRSNGQGHEHPCGNAMISDGVRFSCSDLVGKKAPNGR